MCPARGRWLAGWLATWQEGCAACVPPTTVSRMHLLLTAPAFPALPCVPPQRMMRMGSQTWLLSSRWWMEEQRGSRGMPGGRGRGVRGGQAAGAGRAVQARQRPPPASAGGTALLPTTLPTGTCVFACMQTHIRSSLHCLPRLCRLSGPLHRLPPDCTSDPPCCAGCSSLA